MKKAIALNLIVFFLLVPLLLVFAGGASREEAIITNKLASITNWLFNFLIYGAVIAIIIGAFVILLSGGDPGKASAGRQIVIYALIAVLVGLFSKVLVTWVRNL